MLGPLARTVRRARHPVTTLATVVLGGLLVGVVGGSIAGALLTGQGPGLLASGEHPAALQYAIAVANKDPMAAAGIRPVGPVADRARELLDAEGNRIYEPLALSFVGSGTLGPIGIHVYVLEETDPDLGKWRAPLVLTVVDGTVVRQRP